MDKDTLIPAEPDQQLLKVITYLHAAGEAFDRWEEAHYRGQFHDENESDIREAALAFGKLECQVTDIIGVKMSFDLEMRYKH